MIDFDTIENTLNFLDNQYSDIDNPPSTNMQTFYSKIALLEFSGWIEQSIDLILNEYIKRKGITGSNLEYINKYIQGVYGFKFDPNVCSLFCHTIGIYNWSQIQKKMDLEVFKSIINTYSGKRNTAAHTYTVVMQTYDAPSIIKTNYKKLKKYMQDIELEVNNL